MITKTKESQDKKRPQTKHWLRQREKILNAAGRLFLQKGYLGTSIQDIAGAAKVNKATIYYYFENKAGVLYHIALKAAEELKDQALPLVHSELVPEAKLELLITNHVKWAASRPVLAGISQIERKNLPPKLLSEIVRLRDEYEAVFRKVISETVENGNGRFTNPKLASIFTLSLVNSIHQWYKPRGELTSEKIASEICEFISGALNLSKPVLR